MTMTTTPRADEHLTTGWEPAAPVGDSILRRYLFCSAALFEAFAQAAGGRAMTTPAFAAADTGRPAGSFNSATLLQPPDPATFGEVVDDVEAFFQPGTGQALLWSRWPTLDLAGRGWRGSSRVPEIWTSRRTRRTPTMCSRGADDDVGSSPPDECRERGSSRHASRPARRRLPAKRAQASPTPTASVRAWTDQ